MKKCRCVKIQTVEADSRVESLPEAPLSHTHTHLNTFKHTHFPSAGVCVSSEPLVNDIYGIIMF